jgi:hypothetical protein
LLRKWGDLNGNTWIFTVKIVGGDENRPFMRLALEDDLQLVTLSRRTVGYMLYVKYD